MNKATCPVTRCCAKRRPNESELCAKHHPGTICRANDCESQKHAKGYCSKHYRQFLRHGSITEPKSRNHPKNGYSWVHLQVQRKNGSARNYACHYCKQQAVDWAYDHKATEEFTSPRGSLYCLDPDRYFALCHLCHMRMDAWYRKEYGK